jgi:uncharacterized protein YjiS (DUF1127 family)
MALVQNHRDVFKIDNVVRLNHPSSDAAPPGQTGTLTGRLWQRILQPLSRQRTRLARREPSGLTMMERARQRRELERLSDRELRDIGITRYEIEFVLRQSTRR